MKTKNKEFTDFKIKTDPLIHEISPHRNDSLSVDGYPRSRGNK